MKKKRMVFWGFVVLAVVVIFSSAGCASTPREAVEFPEEFWGTWKREGIDNTLTITSNTYRLSHQVDQGLGHWVLRGISDDTYSISDNRGRGIRGQETIRYVNGNLVIESCSGNTVLDKCGGTWIRQ